MHNIEIFPVLKEQQFFLGRLPRDQESVQESSALADYKVLRYPSGVQEEKQDNTRIVAAHTSYPRFRSRIDTGHHDRTRAVDASAG